MTTTTTDPWQCKFFHPEVVYATRAKPKEEVVSRATVAYRYIDGAIEYNLAILSPGDQFNRRIGRLMSHGRLNKYPVTIKFNHKIEEIDNMTPEDRTLAVSKMKDTMLDEIFKHAISNSTERELRPMRKYRFVEAR